MLLDFSGEESEDDEKQQEAVDEKGVMKKKGDGEAAVAAARQRKVAAASGPGAAAASWAGLVLSPAGLQAGLAGGRGRSGSQAGSLYITALSNSFRDRSLSIDRDAGKIR